MSSDSDPSSIFSGGKAFRCFLLAALALGAASLPPRAWAASAGFVWNVSRCSNTVPIEIIAPGHGSEIIHSPAEISDSLPHFSAFVTAVTEHVAARLDKDDLCIRGAGSVDSKDSRDSASRSRLPPDSMRSAEQEKRSLLQFVHWRFFAHDRYFVPAMNTFGAALPPNCRISSPWADLVVMRESVPQIRGIFRWNERQLIADQAMLAGARNVPLGTAMPLSNSEFGSFLGEYTRTELFVVFPESMKPAPIEERVPPDLLWLLRRAWQSTYSPFIGNVIGAMGRAESKGAEGYTKLVLSLIDRCFTPADKAYFHYNSILDAADPVLLEQYKIDRLLD
jgi:hypothetical protein